MPRPGFSEPEFNRNEAPGPSSPLAHTMQQYQRPVCPTCGSIEVTSNDRSASCRNVRCEDVDIIRPRNKFRADPSSGEHYQSGRDVLGGGCYRRQAVRYD